MASGGDGTRRWGSLTRKKGRPEVEIVMPQPARESFSRARICGVSASPCLFV
jgi:hypothetical protein